MIFFAVIVVFCLLGFGWHRYLWFDLQYDEVITKYCNEYKVQKSLAYAVIKAESNFKTDVVSSKGAVGLMQIMPSTATFVANSIDKKSFDLKNPRDNIQIGIYYLSYLQTKFDDVTFVVASYNAGENKVKKWLEKGGKLLFDETEIYVKKVKRNIKIFESLYN